MKEEGKGLGMEMGWDGGIPAATTPRPSQTNNPPRPPRGGGGGGGRAAVPGGGGIGPGEAI